MARLLLVRHGRSAHVHDGSWVDAADARAFEKLYDAAPIRADSIPPASLVDAAVVSPLLREVSFDLPAWAPKLPVALWDGFSHLVWSARLLARAETTETTRAAQAAEWIESQAPSGGTVIAVTHGGFRRLLSASLARRGWRLSPAPRRYHNWSVWELSRGGG